MYQMADTQADQSLRWMYISLCELCHEIAIVPWILLIKKLIQFLECSWNHEYFEYLARGPSIHDFMNRPKIEYIAYFLHFIINI